MPRAKNAVAARARRKKVLKQTKGNFGARKNVWTVAKNTYEKGLTYAFRDRRKKKSEFRALWICLLYTSWWFHLLPERSGLKRGI